MSAFTAAIQFIRNQLTTLPITTADLTGKTIIITGANGGLGYETARHMARMNPGLLILACRDVKKGHRALETIQKETGCEALKVMRLDLASFESVKSFVTEFASLERNLDILVCNAGVSIVRFERTVDNYETTLQVNYLAAGLLSILLLPKFSRASSSSGAPNPRIVFVTSDTHYLVTSCPEVEHPNILRRLSEPEYAQQLLESGDLYCKTKLFNLFFTRRLAASLGPASPITVSVVNPGFCRTSMPEARAQAFWSDRIIVGAVMYLLGRTAEQGSRTLLDAALSSDKGPQAHGRYLDTCRIGNESSFSRSEEGKQLELRIWDETIEALSAMDERIESIVKLHLTP